MAVVMDHLHNVEHKYFHTAALGIFQFGVLGVDLFFVISGFVISIVTARKFGSAHNARRFLYHRLARVYPVYWVYSAIVLAAFLYNPLLINAGGGHRVNVLASFLLIPTQLPMLVMQGWTLSYEIYFYLVFFLLLFLPERLFPWLLLLWAVLIAGISALGTALASPVAGLISSPSILEFLAGCLLFRLYRSHRLHPYAGLILVALSIIWLTVIMLCTYCFYGFDERWIENSRWLRPELYGSFSAVFLLGVLELERTKMIRFSRILESIGDWSFSIYLSHIVIVELVGRVLSHSLPHLRGASLLVVALSLPLVLIAGFLSYTFLERPLLRLFYKPESGSLSRTSPNSVPG